MNFKRFSTSDNQWHDIPYYQHKTATDTLTLPAVIYPNDTSITVGLKGNEEHTGTPSPQNPVMPNGTGERTGNLYNTTATDWTLGILDDNGQPTGSTSSHYTTNYTEVSPQTAYVLSGTISTTGSLRVYFYSSDKSWISRTAQKTTGDFTTPQNCFYIRIQVTVTIDDTSDWMLNLGSSPLPYEPYGYFIEIEVS